MVLPFSTSGGMSSVTLPLRTGASPITRWIAAFIISGVASARRARSGAVPNAVTPAIPTRTVRRVMWDSLSFVIASSSVPQGHRKRHNVFDLLRRQHRLATKRRCNPFKSIQAVIGRHDRIGVKYARIHDPQPQLAFGVTRPGTFEIGPDGALEFLLRQRCRMTKQAQPGLPARHNGFSAYRIARGAGQRSGDGIADHHIGSRRGVGLKPGNSAGYGSNHRYRSPSPTSGRAGVGPTPPQRCAACPPPYRPPQARESKRTFNRKFRT